ncbi:putative ribonuclease H-like domain-containing protein [Tanacetum coccineum]
MTGNKAYLVEYQDYNGGHMCDKKNKVLFTYTECLVLSPDFKLPDENQVLLRVPQTKQYVQFQPREHCSYSRFSLFDCKGHSCLIAKATIDESNKWHRRLGHVNFKNLNKLVKGNLVRGLPSKIFQNDHTCVACQKGKQHKASCKAKSVSSISQPLQLLHMDLFGPTSVRSLNHKTYCLVITDDFSRCDNGTEFKNRDFIEFYGSKGIKREYSNARTPQQNGVAKRKNMTLIEAARTMLADSFLPNTFWAETVSYIRPFGCHVTILNTIDHLGKFDGKSDEGFLVGYSLQSKAFRIYNLETKRVEENLHITFLENKPNVAGKGPTWLFDLDYLTDSMNYQPVRSENQANKHAGPQEANHNAGTEDNIDAGDSEIEAESAQDYFVLPIWSSYTSTVKSTKAKNAGEEPNKHPDLKPVDKEDQVFLDELERLKRQEQDAYDAAEALRKEFAQETEDLLLQAGAAKASSTNIVNTASTPVCTASPYGGPSFTNLTNTDQDDSEIPALEEIYDNPTAGIFTNASYDDEGAVADFTNLETIVNASPIPTSRISSIHPSTLILGDPKSAVQTRSKVTKSSGAHAFVSYIQKQRRNNHKDFQHCLFACFLSQNEPKKISEALEDESWVDAMQEELLQFKIQKVWILVDLPYGKKAIGTIVYCLVGRRKLGQMDVKSAFLYGTIDEEVYVSQPLGFVDPKFPKKVYKIVKALYGLHQAPRAWYATLSIFLLKNGYRRGTIDKTLFIKKDKNDIISMIGSLMYLTASRPDIMFLQSMICSRFLGYFKDLPSVCYERGSLVIMFGANLDRKSTIGGCQFLGRRLIFMAVQEADNCGYFTTEADSQTVNDEKQIHATVDSKAVVVTEASIRSSLLLNDADEGIHWVLALETSKDAQAAKILKLKYRIKKLEKKWQEPTLDAFDDLDADLAHGMDYMDTEEAVTEGRQSKETEELNVTPIDTVTQQRMTRQSLKEVEIKEKKDAERPARLVLTLKLLLKIDPKDKSKGVLGEEPKPVKVKSRSKMGLKKKGNMYPWMRKSKFLAEYALKIGRSSWLKKEQLQSGINLQQGFNRRNLRTTFDANAEDDIWKNQEEWILRSWNFYENYGVHTLILEDELASPKQTDLGKDISNPLIVDSLLKTIWLSMHHVIAMKHWLFQSKRLLVKAKDLDLWHIILNGDFPPLAKNKETQILEIVPFEKQGDDLKKKLAKNNEAKMVLYNALPKKEYERIFMCKTDKDIWQSFGFARFNTIITSLKALDEGFSSKNYVRKFLRALHPKWRAKVTAIEESKDLSSLDLDELIGNLKVHEVVMEKDSKIYRGKKERVKSIALKAKKESSDDETSTSGSDDEEYAMAVKNFKRLFRRKGKFVGQPREEKKSFRQRDEKKEKSDLKCFRCGDPNNLIGDCPKPPRNKDQKAFIGGSWSDSENNAEEKTNDETCLMAQSLNEEVLELNEKIKKLKRSKEIDTACKLCQELKLKNARIKETQVKFVKFDKSANSLREMLDNQKPSSCKIGLGFDSSKASTSRTKPISFVGSSAENATDGSTIKVHGSTIPGSVSRTVAENVTEHVFSRLMSLRSDFVITRNKPLHNRIDESKKPSLKPSLKSGLGYVKTESKSKTPPPRRNISSQQDTTHLNLEPILENQFTKISIL